MPRDPCLPECVAAERMMCWMDSMHDSRVPTCGRLAEIQVDTGLDSVHGGFLVRTTASLHARAPIWFQRMWFRAVPPSVPPLCGQILLLGSHTPALMCKLLEVPAGDCRVKNADILCYILEHVLVDGEPMKFES